MARTKLGAARRGQAAAAAAAGPQLHRLDAYLVHPSLVARPPPPWDWATALPRNTTKLDLIFFGVPVGLAPVVFRKKCADAGVPGLAYGKLRREGAVLRVTVHNRMMIGLIRQFGINRFSRELRRVHGWRCIYGCSGGAGKTRPRAQGADHHVRYASSLTLHTTRISILPVDALDMFDSDDDDLSLIHI